MQTNVSWDRLTGAPASRELLRYFSESENKLNLQDAHIYYRFPIYRSPDDVLIETSVILISPRHGIIVFWAIEFSPHDFVKALRDAESTIDQLYSCILSRLIRNKFLKKDRSSLAIPIYTAIYCPYDQPKRYDEKIESAVLRSTDQLGDFLRSILREPMPVEVFKETLSTLDGSKGLIKPKPREIASLSATSRGCLAERLEAEVALFDQRQMQGYTAVGDGVHRIRGLAGSGKTIVLAMRAALTHLRFPDARIVYTFHTKSLYQLVKRLVTRFYRQFEDRDPDWDERILILHGWGGSGMPGIYSEACRAHDVPCLSYADACMRTINSPFEFACKDLLGKADIKPMYDFVFVDEGQDFPLSFLQLCKALAKNERMILAYDELQTIFQAKAPTAAEIFGTTKDGTPYSDFAEDIVLYKCYRNPREIIVCSHAVGLGIYGKKIVQMLENKEHWEDTGYRVIEGDFREGSKTVIERPKENSLSVISESQRIDDLIKTAVFKSLHEEVEFVAVRIKADLDDGLRPDDILVITVDDRHAKEYLHLMTKGLAKRGIESNNMHSDPYGLRDFYVPKQVTLSTVHKAKGNEAYAVYIIGVDALFDQPSVRKRNMLFTAMTRAKGWVHVSGEGEYAENCAQEIADAKANFPNLMFKYPSERALTVMRRDLQRAAVEKQRIDRIFDELLAHLSPEEARQYLEDKVQDQQRTGKGPAKKIVQSKK